MSKKLFRLFRQQKSRLMAMVTKKSTKLFILVLYSKPKKKLFKVSKKLQHFGDLFYDVSEKTKKVETKQFRHMFEEKNLGVEPQVEQNPGSLLIRTFAYNFQISDFFTQRDI